MLKKIKRLLSPSLEEVKREVENLAIREITIVRIQNTDIVQFQGLAITEPGASAEEVLAVCARLRERFIQIRMAELKRIYGYD